MDASSNFFVLLFALVVVDVVDAGVAVAVVVEKIRNRKIVLRCVDVVNCGRGEKTDSGTIK